MTLHIPFMLVLLALFLAPLVVPIAIIVWCGKGDDEGLAHVVYCATVITGLVCWTFAGFLIGRG